MCDSSKFSDHAQGARDIQHNDKLMSRNTISGRDTWVLSSLRCMLYNRTKHGQAFLVKPIWGTFAILLF